MGAHGGVMVTAINSVSSIPDLSGPSPSPYWGHKNLMLGVTLQWVSIQRGITYTPSRFTLQRPVMSFSLLGHLDCI